MEEMRYHIAKLGKCENCKAPFQFLPDGKIWNVRYETFEVDESEVTGDISFWSNIHPSIMASSKQLFENKHYKQCVLDALIEVNNRVKTPVKNATGNEEDGKGLMFTAFNIKNPIITLDNPSTKIGRDIQEGYMHLFAGTMQGVRNPKAHDNFVIDKNRAIHFPYLASLLMHKLDEVGVK